MTPYGFFVAAGAVTAIAWLRRQHRAMGLGENEFWAALWLIAAGRSEEHTSELPSQ